jgi:hypothetical protein
MPVNPQKALKPVPALETTGIGVARFGTAIWALLAVISWVWPNSPQGLTQVAIAGTFLGVIGLLHVTRRARKLGLAIQGRFPK